VIKNDLIRRWWSVGVNLGASWRFIWVLQDGVTKYKIILSFEW
jgi:uncharacterized protein YndB with AHSA1/START domain